MESWKFKYGKYEIEVKNSMAECGIFVDGKQVAEHKGIDLGAEMIGDLPNGEKVLAVIRSGFITMNCSVYIVKEELKEK